MERQAADVHLGRRQLEVEPLGEGDGAVAGGPRDARALLLHAAVVLVEGEPDVGLVLVPLELTLGCH